MEMRLQETGRQTENQNKVHVNAQNDGKQRKRKFVERCDPAPRKASIIAMLEPRDSGELYSLNRSISFVEVIPRLPCS